MKIEGGAAAAHVQAVELAERPERHFSGLGVSAGIAVGPAHVVERGLIDVPEYRIEDDEVEAEIARFHDAVALSASQIRQLQAQAEAEEGAGKRRSVVEQHQHADAQERAHGQEHALSLEEAERGAGVDHVGQPDEALGGDGLAQLHEPLHQELGRLVEQAHGQDEG